MNTTAETSTITGERIFFNFIEVPFEKLAESGDLIKKLKTGEIHGFVLKNLFSKQEIADMLKALVKPLEEKAMVTPSGKMFPAPFAIITNSGERLDAYYESMDTVHELMDREPVLKMVPQRLKHFFDSVGRDY